MMNQTGEGPMAKRSITIRLVDLGDKLEPSDLITALQNTIAILKGIDQAVTGKSKPTLHWYIRRIEMQSPLTATLEYERVDRGKRRGRSPEVIRPFLSGVSQLDKRERVPRYFGEAELTRLKRIVDLNKGGFPRVEFYSKGEEDTVRPTTAASDHVATLLGDEGSRPYVEYSELEGRLELLSLHPETPEFAIYDSLTDQPVVCRFNKADLDRVTSYLKKKARVVVAGDARYNSRHFATSINVEHITPLHEQSQLPQLRDLHRDVAIDWSDTEDVVELARGLRDG